MNLGAKWLGVLALACALSACEDAPEQSEPELDASLDDVGVADVGVDGASSDVGADDGSIEDRPVAAVLQPRSTPPDECPSGDWAGERWFDGPGVCRAELPRLLDWTCPLGWLPSPALTDDTGAQFDSRGLTSTTICEPPPRPTCGPGEIATAKDAACRPIGLDCPVGTTFHDEATIRARVPGFDGAIIYVDASASSDGDGSLANPRNRAQRAVVDAADGDIVVLAAGAYRRVAFLNNVALVGSCAESTFIDAGTMANDDGAIAIGDSGGTYVSDLTIRGPKLGVVAVNPVAPVTLQSLIIDQTLAAGIVTIDVAQPFRVKDVIIRSPMLGSALQAGVRVDRSSDVVLDGVVIEDPQRYGIRVQGDVSNVQANDVVIERVKTAPDGQFGYGVSTGADVDVSLSRSLIIEPANFGVIAGGSASTTLSLQDVVLRDVTRQPDQLNAGLAAGEGATLRAERVLVEGVRDMGGAFSVANAELEDVVIRDVSGRADGSWGHGLVLTESTGSLRRVVVEDTRAGGLFVEGSSNVSTSDAVFRRFVQRGGSPHGMRFRDSEATLQRVLVEDPAREALINFGSAVVATDVTLRPSKEGASTGWDGVHVIEGGTVQALRVTIEDFRRSAISLGHEGTRFNGTDVVIERGEDAADLATAARCLNQDPGTELTLERALVTNAAALGGFAIGGVGRYTDFVLSDLTPSAQSPGGGGDGFQVAREADVVFERAVFDNIQHVGLVVWDTEVVATDFVVRGVYEPRDGQNAAGIGMVQGGSINVTRGLFEGNQDSGIMLASTAVSTFRDVEVRGTHAGEDGGPGFGLSLQRDSNVVVEGGWIHGNVGRGITVFTGAHAELVDTLIEGSGPEQGQVPGSDPDGIYLGSGATLSATDCSIRDNQRHGLVASDASATLTRCTITGNEIGVALELEADVELIECDVSGNEEQESSCLAQCYDRPEETDSLPVLPGG